MVTDPEKEARAALDLVARTWGLVDAKQLLFQNRDPELVRARHTWTWVVRHWSGLPLTKIARICDRDHSTVLHALRSFDARLEAAGLSRAYFLGLPSWRLAIDELHRALQPPAIIRPPAPLPSRRPCPSPRRTASGLIKAAGC